MSLSREVDDARLKKNGTLPGPLESTIIIVEPPGKLLDNSSRRIGNTYNDSRIWSWKNRLPCAMLTVSFLEVCSYAVSNEKFKNLLRFDPNKLPEIWRFITYMLLHNDWIHLCLNIFMQVIFAYNLEIRHGRLRILMLYLTSGITGVLGASCFHPDLVIGASGGVYALLISHVADIIMNFENMDHKFYRCSCIMVIVISDIAYNVVHVYSRNEPLISWGAHIIGGISGLFFGFIFFKQEEWLARVRKLCLFWLGLILYVILFMSLVILTFQIKKCTPSNIIRTQYIYFC